MKFSEIVTERVLEVKGIISFISQNNPTWDEVREFIKKNYERYEYWKGRYAFAIGSIADDREYIIKVNRVKDPAYDAYSDLSKTYADSNSLFPKILYKGILKGGTHIYIVEYLIVDKTYYFNSGLSAELMKLATRALIEESSDQRQFLLDFKQTFESAGGNYDEFVRWVHTCSELLLKYEPDMNARNTGWRNNGEVVLFDPINTGELNESQ
jgi:hypothetical protein